MTFLSHLPEDVTRAIRTAFVAEYASVSSVGVPIDTPTLVFVSADDRTLDLATGLAYPAKAERPRKNPKVGLLIGGAMPNAPVVSVAGLATVRDADLQANFDRYLAETVIQPPMSRLDWTTSRQAVWYLTRIFINITPTHIRWWKNPSAMDGTPQEWRAPAGTTAPPSDPVPPGKTSAMPDWPQPPWQELVQTALVRKAPGHLTLLDAEGYPLPIGVREVASHKEGFSLVVPKGAPWSRGKATLSFEGREMFVGDATIEGGKGLLRVARALPVFPLTEDVSQVLQPKPENRARLMKRLEAETKRRNQPIPTAPAHPPEPTPGSKLRMAALTALLKR